MKPSAPQHCGRASGSPPPLSPFWRTAPCPPGPAPSTRVDNTQLSAPEHCSRASGCPPQLGRPSCAVWHPPGLPLSTAESQNARKYQHCHFRSSKVYLLSVRVQKIVSTAYSWPTMTIASSVYRCAWVQCSVCTMTRSGADLTAVLHQVSQCMQQLG